MIDAHVHIIHGVTGEYTIDLVNHIAEQAKQKRITELFLLEHTHQFYEFAAVYQPVAGYNAYQKNWLARKMSASLAGYTFLSIASETMSFQ
jgi:histidinol-phosphatase (PHP family)